MTNTTPMSEATKKAYQEYAYAKQRLKREQGGLVEAERAYIDALLADRRLSKGDLVSSKDRTIALKIVQVVVDGENGILCVKGPSVNNDGRLSKGKGQRRVIMVKEHGLVPYVAPDSQ